MGTYMGRVYKMEGIGGREMAGGSGEEGEGEEWMKTIEEMSDRRGLESGEGDVDDGEKEMDEREKRQKGKGSRNPRRGIRK